MADQFVLNFEVRAEPIPQLWTPDQIYDNLSETVLQKFKEDRRIEKESGPGSAACDG